MVDLYQGDCLEIMDALIENDVKVDAVITDPPFLHIKGGMKCKRYNKGILGSKSFMNTKMRDFGKEKIYQMLDKCNLILSKAFNGYFYCSELQIVHYLDWTIKNKLRYNVLIWDRLKYGVISSKSYISGIDYVVRIYGKGRGLNKIIRDDDGKINSTLYRKIYSSKKPKVTSHETEKPLEMIKTYIKLSSNKNDIILDPFMGSGTTGVACKNLNRNFIGIELDEKYFKIAEERINE